MKASSQPKGVQVGFTTSYIIECEGGYLVIDTGYPQDYAKFVKKLKTQHQIESSEIKYIFLTHHHDDHAGFAAELLKNTGAKLIVHEAGLEWLNKGVPAPGMRPLNGRVKMLFGLFGMFHEFRFPPVIPSEEDRILREFKEDTKLLKEIGINGTILYTPGHTQDGMSIVLAEGTVFPGDNVMNAWYFNICGIKKWPVFVQDLDLVLESWEKYLELGGETVYPAHGKSFDIRQLQKELKGFKRQ